MINVKNPPRISNALPVSVWTDGRPVTLLQLDEATPSIKLSRARTGDQYYTTANRATNQKSKTVLVANVRSKVVSTRDDCACARRLDYRVADVINHCATRTLSLFFGRSAYDRTVTFFCCFFRAFEAFSQNLFIHSACVGNGKLYSSTSNRALSRLPAEASPRRPLRATGQPTPTPKPRPGGIGDLQAHQVVGRLPPGKTNHLNCGC